MTTEPTTEAERNAARLADAVLDKSTVRAMTECAERGYFASRNLKGILAVSTELNAHAPAVAAAFGFLPSAFRELSDSEWVDLLSPNAPAELSEDIRTHAGVIIFRATVGWNSGPMVGVITPLPPDRRPRHSSVIDIAQKKLKPQTALRAKASYEG